MTNPPAARYPEPRTMPPGVLRFALVSVAASAGVGLLITAWAATQLALGPGGQGEATEYAVTWGPTFVIVTALISVVPIGAAIVSGLLARRVRSIFLRCTVVAASIFTPTLLVVAWLLGAPVGGIEWGPVLAVSAIPAVVLTASAVLPWRGGFASLRPSPPLKYRSSITQSP